MITKLVVSRTPQNVAQRAMRRPRGVGSEAYQPHAYSHGSNYHARSTIDGSDDPLYGIVRSE